LERFWCWDGVAQCDEKYEFIYHEFMAHVPLYAHPNPETVLIVGGGDGGVLREVLKHPEVKRAVLVDIDREVIEVSKRFLPTMACAFEDPRVIVLNEDGYKYIQDYENEFDVIIVDSTDPVGFAHVLTTEEFFRYVYRALKEDGIYVGQTGVHILSHRDGEAYPKGFEKGLSCGGSIHCGYPGLCGLLVDHLGGQ